MSKRSIKPTYLEYKSGTVSSKLSYRYTRQAYRSHKVTTFFPEYAPYHRNICCRIIDYVICSRDNPSMN